jgi:hypothetical protein
MSFCENSTRDDEAAGVHKLEVEDDGGDDDVVDDDADVIDCVHTRC